MAQWPTTATGNVVTASQSSGPRRTCFPDKAGHATARVSIVCFAFYLASLGAHVVRSSLDFLSAHLKVQGQRAIKRAMILLSSIAGLEPL